MLNTALTDVMVRQPIGNSNDKRMIRATVISRDGDKLSVVPTDAKERAMLNASGRRSLAVLAQDTEPVHSQSLRPGTSITKMYPTNDNALANRHQW